MIINDRGITVADKDGKQRVLREDIQSIFADGKDLAIADPSGMSGSGRRPMMSWRHNSCRS